MTGKSKAQRLKSKVKIRSKAVIRPAMIATLSRLNFGRWTLDFTPFIHISLPVCNPHSELLPLT